MTNNKITNKSALEYAIKTISAMDNANAEMVEKLNAMLAQVSKKSNSASKAKAEKAKVNEALCLAILEFMEADHKYSATEIFEGIEGITSTSKATSLLGNLVDTGEVVREVEKRKPYFRLAKMSDFQ